MRACNALFKYTSSFATDRKSPHSAILSVYIVTLSNVLNTEVKRYDRIIYFRLNEMSGDDDFHLGLILSGLIVLLLGAIYLLSRIWLSE